MADPSHITLRDPRPGDAEAHAAVPASAEILRMYGAKPGTLPERSLARSQAWLDWLTDHPFGKIIALDGAAIGHVRLHSLSQADQSARLGIGLFTEDVLGHGFGRQAIFLTLDHAFGAMGLRAVDLRVLAYNIRAIRCYRACGFSHVETEPNAVEIDGVWQDDWIMAIRAEDHRRKARLTG